MTDRYSAGGGEQDGIATVVLRDADAQVEAAFAPGAGMVGCSLRHRGEELLGQRKGLRAYAETGSTMGIPLLHPWANRLEGFGYAVGARPVRIDPDSPRVRADENGLPIHGLLGGSPLWEVQEAAASAGDAHLRAALDFAGAPELLAGFPFPHRVDVEARLAGGALTIATTVTPTGEAAVPISFGWHPYLQLPGLPRSEWHVHLPVRRRLVLDARGLPTGKTEDVEPFDGAVGDRTWDDGYDRLEEPATFTLRGGGREVAVSFDDEEGYPVAQVFAPPGQELICFEPMTAPTNALASGDGLRLAAPGEPFRATFRIAIG